MKRAITIVGRFAFGGWAIFTGTTLAIFLVACLVQKAFGFDFLWVLFFGLFGGIGGAVVGLAAAVLDRLVKPPAGKVAKVNKAADADPAVWPPAPKPPK